MNESQATKRLLKALKAHGHFWKISDRFRAGIPDIVGVYQGRFIAVEMKVDYRKVTPLQEHEIAMLQAHGGTVHTVRFSNRSRSYSVANMKFDKTKELAEWILRPPCSSTKGSALKQ